MTGSLDLIVVPLGNPATALRGHASLDGRRWPCALGRGGVRAATDKREGDGATPAGRFPLRRLLYRADRIAPPPRCALPASALMPVDGWCDDPADRAYNRAVMLPYPASCEALWRADAVYDLILVTGHNDDPPAAGAGSAIFAHCAQPDFAPTEGCVAFARADLLELLALLAPGSAIDIRLG
jgi:L,D-peptidoglycan transpeptidase YkuD (ErfK/YbiS/YcfS/YnhG family)